MVVGVNVRLASSCPTVKLLAIFIIPVPGEAIAPRIVEVGGKCSLFGIEGRIAGSAVCDVGLSLHLVSLLSKFFLSLGQFVVLPVYQE